MHHSTVRTLKSGEDLEMTAIAYSIEISLSPVASPSGIQDLTQDHHTTACRNRERVSVHLSTVSYGHDPVALSEASCSRVFMYRIAQRSPLE